MSTGMWQPMPVDPPTPDQLKLLGLCAEFCSQPEVLGVLHAWLRSRHADVTIPDLTPDDLKSAAGQAYANLAYRLMTEYWSR